MTADDDALFGAGSVLRSSSGEAPFVRLAALEDAGIARLEFLPNTVKILLENLLRTAAAGFASSDDVAALAGWGQGPLEEREFPFSPARVILQDFTGVPAVVDLAAMRSAMEREGGDPSRVDPLVPVDLVIDHSVQVDAFGTPASFQTNVDREYERNHER